METLSNLLVIMLIALPVFILIALLSGYYITSRAFKPVSQIQKTAELIIRKRDLSSRINLQGSVNDELFRLAQTYDELLDRVEDSFNNEKQFNSDVSHELRTPVSVIISQAEYGLSEDNPQIMKESLQSILRQTEHMSEMITQLLELSRTGNNLQNLNRETFNLAELCELVADELAEKAHLKNIQIIRKLDPDISVEADQTLLMRAIINLVTNSISYGKNNGFTILDLHRESDRIILSVSDDGAGIAPEHLGKIFNRFYRADQARTRGESSNTGLGLAMVKQIVEAHDGVVSVQSTPGVGSTFTISLPVVPSDER
jgi:signal transduction histidine kinase